MLLRFSHNTPLMLSWCLWIPLWCSLDAPMISFWCYSDVLWYPLRYPLDASWCSISDAPFIPSRCHIDAHSHTSSDKDMLVCILEKCIVSIAKSLSLHSFQNHSFISKDHVYLYNFFLTITHCKNMDYFQRVNVKSQGYDMPASGTSAPWVPTKLVSNLPLSISQSQMKRTRHERNPISQT